jgi:hypothetical protein
VICVGKVVARQKATVNTINAIFKKTSRPAFSLVFLAAIFLTCSSFATQSVTLTWNSSPSSDVTGYKIYYGTVSGSYSNVVSVGAVTNATISGLAEGATYYFAATTYSSNLNLESTLSNETSYTVPSQAKLAIQVAQDNGVATAVSITASGAVPNQWVLEASTDLRNWAAVLSGTNTAINFSMPVTGLPAQFFRLMAE